MAPTDTYPPREGDLIVGKSCGEDVKRIQDILKNYFGYDIPDEAGFYGEATYKAAVAFRDKMALEQQSNPLLAEFKKYILREVFHIDVEDLDPQYARGERLPISRYFFDDEATLKYKTSVRNAEVWGQGGAISNGLNFAYQTYGQREQGGNNRGPIVSLCGGPQGEPWCGYWAGKVADAIHPQLYSQNPGRALSFKDEAEKYGAFRSVKEDPGYGGQVGDMIVFTRGNGKGHIGYVVKREGNSVTYMSGNTSDGVAACVIKDITHPPAGLIGFSDTRALASAKHIDLQLDGAAANRQPVLAATLHNAKSYLRG